MNSRQKHDFNDRLTTITKPRKLQILKIEYGSTRINMQNI